MKPPVGRGCGRLSAAAALVDQVVVEAATEFVDGPDLAQVLGQLERDGDLGAMARDQEALEQLADDYYVSRIITREEYLKAREGLEAKLRNARTRLERKQGATMLADLAASATPLAADWEGYTVDERRAVLDALFQVIVVLPVPRPGPRVPMKDRLRLDRRV